MIFETIVTTQSADGRVHIAPMGVREVDDFVELAPFRPSTTLDNILARGCAVVNFTDDVRVFAGCVTGRRYDWPTQAAERVFCMRLSDALAHSELVLDRVEEDELRPRLLCRRAFDASHRPFRGFNRAQAAVVEAAILVSRLRMLPAEKIDAELAYLTIAVEKTAGEAEQEAWGWLLDRIRDYRRSHKDRAAVCP